MGIMPEECRSYFGGEGGWVTGQPLRKWLIV